MKVAALLVGINAYPGAPLRGCLPDVADMQDYLLRSRGWTMSQIRVLLDRDATREGILRGIDWLVDHAPDLVLFAYSGHGTRLRDEDGDEAASHSGTKYDQAIVPIDYAKNGFLLDDDLYEAFSHFPKETKVIYHLDSCFSARAERELIARGREFFNRRILRRSDRTLPIRLLTSCKSSFNAKQQKITSGDSTPRPILLLSACRSTETAADARIPDAGYRGAFTYYLLRSARALGPTASYGAVLEDARRLLEINRYVQRPQITPTVRMPVGWSTQPFLQ